jgi:hypothetical protein
MANRTEGGKPITLFSGTKAANFSGSTVQGLGAYRDLIVTLDITAAERDSANETYDVYVTGGDGVAEWDIVHFPQVLTTGAKRFTAIVSGTSRPTNASTADPGVEAVTSGVLTTTAAGAGHGAKTLGAGLVRHGPWGDRVNHHLVVAGTIVTGIAYSITVTPK